MTAFFAAFARQLVFAPIALWYWHTRRCDLHYLWPACKNEALRRRDEMGWGYQDALDHARAAFAVHAYKDAGWQWLGDEEIARRIDGLHW